MEKKVKILKGKEVFVGVGYREVSQRNAWGFLQYGFYLYCKNGMLCPPGGSSSAYRNQAVEEGSIVTVKLDAEFNISFAVDGGDWGVAFRKITKDHFNSLHLAVVFGCDPRNKTVLCEGQVELLT